MNDAPDNIAPISDQANISSVDLLAQRRADIDAKQGSVAELLQELRRDGVLLMDPENVSWMTAGAAPSGILNPDEMPVLLVGTEARCLICANVDTQRLFDEELYGLGFQLKEWPWHWSRTDYLTEMCQGRSLACDRNFCDARPAADSLLRLRRVLSVYEQDCLRSLGQAVGHALEATCRTMKRCQTEEEIAGQISHRLLHRGIRPVSLSVIADGRSLRYRRGGYTAAPVQFYCVASATAEKNGLYVSATRSVCFGPPSPELAHAVESVCKVTAIYIATSQPKGVVRDILAAGRRIYSLCGFEHEWHCSPQGHLTGRLPVELLFMPNMLEFLQPGSAVTWQASIGAAAACDTILVTERGPELITATDLWPLKAIRAHGIEIQRPALLVREPALPTAPALA